MTDKEQALAVRGNNLLACNFCGKTEADGVALICGPAIYICSECIEVCLGVLGERGWTLQTVARLRAELREVAGVLSGDGWPCCNEPSVHALCPHVGICEGEASDHACCACLCGEGYEDE